MMVFVVDSSERQAKEGSGVEREMWEVGEA